MSGSKTKNVGGQSVSPVAQDFTSFLQQALGQTQGSMNNTNSQLGGNTGAFGAPPQQANVANVPAQQQQGSSPFQDALNGLLSGNQNQIDIQGMLGGNSNFQVNPTGMDDPQMQAIKAISDQQNAANIANLNERFTQSGTAQGTPAAYANSNYLSQAGPQLIQALSQAANANAGIQLQNQGLNNQNQQAMVQALLGQQGQNQQGQMAALQQLFNSLNQANQMGTTQAQTIQKPSTFQNIVGGVTGVLGALPGIGSAVQGIGNIFGGGQQIPQMGGTPGMTNIGGGYQPQPMPYVPQTQIPSVY